MDQTGLKRVMETVAVAWNSNNAVMAASCFAEDAIYSRPPSREREDRAALFEYSGGAQGRKYPMRMQWHNMAFDPVTKIGFGEFTFKYEIQTHGVVVVEISHGLISRWREYEAESAAPWNTFVGKNDF